MFLLDLNEFEKYIKQLTKGRFDRRTALHEERPPDI